MASWLAGTSFELEVPSCSDVSISPLSLVGRLVDCSYSDWTSDGGSNQEGQCESKELGGESELHRSVECRCYLQADFLWY